MSRSLRSIAQESKDYYDNPPDISKEDINIRVKAALKYHLEYHWNQQDSYKKAFLSKATFKRY